MFKYGIYCATLKDFQFCYLGTEYYLGKLGTECSASEIVSKSKECKDAATKLGLYYGGTFYLNYRPAGCYYVSYNHTNYTFFNLADPSETHNIKPNAGGVCQRGISDNL